MRQLEVYIESSRAKRKPSQASQYNFRPADIEYIPTNHREDRNVNLYKRHSILKTDNMMINDMQTLEAQAMARFRLK